MTTARLIAAQFFAVAFILPALIALGAILGGWWLFGAPVYAWIVSSLLDGAMGKDGGGADPATPDSALLWHRFLTWAWVPTQTALILGAIWAASVPGHLSGAGAFLLMVGVGVAAGAVGITYAHEMIHSTNRWERAAGEILLASVAYGHFASEHLGNHHRYVGTPKDPVTARYGEGFWRFLPRAVWGTAASAWEIDMRRLRARGRGFLSRSNPWIRHGAITGAFLFLAYIIGGWRGVGLYASLSAVAIPQLEAVNYVEHYGLVRKHLGGGRYEPAKPRHSWNASQRMTNLLLINLQRHSDHHVKPDRRFPLLQSYREDEAPQLPFGYPLMVLIAMNPPLWFRVMNRRVKAWRRLHYPEITDWSAYKAGLTPMPR